MNATPIFLVLFGFLLFTSTPITAGSTRPADISFAVADSPDLVVVGNNVAYSVTVRSIPKRIFMAG